MSHKILQRSAKAVEVDRLISVVDDFVFDADTNQFSTVATDSGTATVGDAVGGVLVLAPSDGTVADNDEVYVRTANELFKFASDKPAYFKARIQYAEANTDDANIAFGFMNAVAANSILDNGGGPAADYSGAVFFKVDGGTVWNCENSDSTTQKTTVTDVTAGGSSYVEFEIEVQPKAGSKMDIVFKINGVVVAKHSDQTFANATEMCAFVGAKNGGANNESISVDYIIAEQLR
jgi:hypothetical protein